MRELAVRVEVARGELLDTAGTGGGRGSFNVRRPQPLIAAGAGCAVAKHGNARRPASRAPPTCSRRSRQDRPEPGGGGALHRETGFGFMFAPPPPRDRAVAPVRRELAVRTIFNFSGR